VVIHDETTKRVTGVDSLVRECTAARLQSLDAGSWFGDAFRDEGIPLSVPFPEGQLPNRSSRASRVVFRLFFPIFALMLYRPSCRKSSVFFETHSKSFLTPSSGEVCGSQPKSCFAFCTSQTNTG